MTFRELITSLADRVGHQHIPVNQGSHDIHQFLGHDGVHHDLIKLTVRKIYKANHCGHLDAKVEWRPSIKTAIGIRNSVIQSHSADVEQVQLFDDLINGISQLLPWEEAVSEIVHSETETTTVRILNCPNGRKKQA